MPANSLPSTCSIHHSTSQPDEGGARSERGGSVSSLLQKEWSEFSVVLEMKMGELAVVSVSCPVVADADEPAATIRFGDKSIEFIRQERQKDGTTEPQRYVVTFTNIHFEPNTVQQGTWSDQRGLFCCKVELSYRDYLGGIRRFSELQSFMAAKLPLAAYCERLYSNGAQLSCADCRVKLFESAGQKTCQFVPQPDLDLSCECEDASEYLFHSCAVEHKEKLPEQNHNIEADLLKQPTNKKAIVTETQLWMRHNNNFGDTILLDKKSRVVSCKHCLNELGRLAKGSANIIRFDLPAVIVEEPDASKCLVEERFHSLERFFAFLLLRKSAHDDCLKLLVRTADKTPYLLVWLMEPIFVFADGRMKHVPMDTNLESPKKGQKPCKVKKKALVDSSLINACTALKVLYRLFDDEEPKSEGKLHGVDSSVALLDLPQGTCMHFEEVLLRNSARLPAQSRFLGNFLISFLTVDDE